MSSVSFTATKMLFAIVFASLLNGTVSVCLQAQTVLAVMQKEEPVPVPLPTVGAAPELLLQSPMMPIQEFVQQAEVTNAISASATEPIEQTPMAQAAPPAMLSSSENAVPQAKPSSPMATTSCSHGPNCRCNCYANQRRTYSAYHPSHVQRKQASYWGYPEYFCEPGLGSSIYTAMQAQKDQGVIQQTVLYRCDFYPESSPLASQLTPYGKRRLEKLACRAILSGIPLRIERCADNHELDEIRKQFVAVYSSENNLGWTADMVCLVDRVPSISGPEALIQYRNLLMQTTAGPSSAGSNSGTRGSTSGATSGFPAATGNAPTTR